MASPSSIIHAGALLAEPGQSVSGQTSIRVENGRIVALAPGFVAPPEGADLIDLKHAFVMPGLMTIAYNGVDEIGINRLFRKFWPRTLPLWRDAITHGDARRTRVKLRWK